MGRHTNIQERFAMKLERNMAERLALRIEAHFVGSKVLQAGNTLHITWYDGTQSLAICTARRNLNKTEQYVAKASGKPLRIFRNADEKF